MLTFHRACWIGRPTAGPFSIALSGLLRQQMGKPATLRADAISAMGRRARSAERVVVAGRPTKRFEGRPRAASPGPRLA